MDKSWFSVTELIFLGVAILVTIPFLFLLKWILKELKNEQAKPE